jgi:hypothetical protein
MEFTKAQEQTLVAYLNTHILAKGVGDEKSACSIAAINLAINGELSDKIPDCMSEVIGFWIIRIQDAMPEEMRNSDRWKRLLPLAAGTGREPELEKQRRDLILDWMWEKVLPELSPVEDRSGFGDQWREMLKLRTYDAASAAYVAARAVRADAAVRAASAAAVRAAVHADADAAAAYVAADAADAAAAACVADASGESPYFWEKVSPCILLESLVNIN